MLTEKNNNVKGCVNDMSECRKLDANSQIGL